jgi:hypothetical protein
MSSTAGGTAWTTDHAPSLAWLLAVGCMQAAESQMSILAIGDWGGQHTSPYYTQVDIKDEGRRFTTESFRIYTALNILVC